MVENKKRAKLLTIATAFVLWLMLTSIMGASASHFDSELVPASFTGFASSRWTQTTRTDFFYDARAHVDIDRQPGDVVLNGRTEFLYAFQGGNSRTFWRYNISTSAWAALANAPSKLKEDGSSLASDGDRYLYAIQGGTRQFWRYDTISNSWTSMQHTPDNVKSGGGLVTYNGNGIFFALQGDASNRFWRYNVASDSWTVLANAPGVVSDGGCLVCDQKNFVYALQGNGQRAFWRYNVTSNSWGAMAPISNAVRYGGAMTYGGNNSIYSLPGWSQAYFLRYSITENRWYTLSNIPTTVSYGGSLVFSYPGALYAFSGGGAARIYRYDISTLAWSAATSAPGNVAAGGSLANGALVNSRSGTLTSTTYDTGKIDCSFQGLFWNETLAAMTDISFEMRASDTLVSGSPDTSWIYLGGASPLTTGLPRGQYIQWRATLTTTNVHFTPLLQEVRVYYA
jgi:outer membrane protein assembly factor BamB